MYHHNDGIIDLKDGAPVTAKADETINYLPDLYVFVEKGVILTEGLYLALIVSPDVDNLKAAFEAAVNVLTPVGPRCPHMGCVLKWNEQERSWDCPCHGSRFDRRGRLLDNPANGNAKI